MICPEIQILLFPALPRLRPGGFFVWKSDREKAILLRAPGTGGGAEPPEGKGKPARKAA
jgi:hypothetical protein